MEWSGMGIGVDWIVDFFGWMMTVLKDAVYGLN